ncbi:MAG: inorganic diphosphatase [Ignavibacteriota bacterium]|jgi:inorganic pyrophosphatase|nr:MAG: inorganic diphosphatase [Chlorobiota bacterium]MBE7477978.1 inorganic diphosphatase [Ignavibacteriales bacterium]MBL1123491.1 inorganic diphosphatase [Ignavibacteriota bacterium]MCC7095321.1 inorganic diphosphatase [Ignavibacteriaceae bacterium]MCE7857470.1 inorganic diphosphatase [Ignavibacteria bacterium CHB3]
MNPWHQVNPGSEAPQVVNSIIEIPKGSKAKYELDKNSGLIKLDRVLFSAVHYPANYGFIPQTYCEDNDPLDILVICSIDVDPLCIIETRVLGVMHMVDEKMKDDKIIGVAKNDIALNYINDLSELPPHTMVELQRFFEDYKKLENKQVTVKNFLGKQEAYKIINDSLELYDKNKNRLVSE